MSGSVVPPTVDSLSMLVVVDNITDALSPQPSGVKCVPDTMRTIMASAVSKEPKPHDHPAGCPTMDFACMCDAAHGYSVLLTATKDGKSRTVLFDAGPHARVFTTNAGLLALDFKPIEAIFLSHWHVDHSGGLPSAVQLAAAARFPSDPPVQLSLHPDYVRYRGTRMPTPADAPPRYVTMPANPSPDELEALGGKIMLGTNGERGVNEPHLLADLFYCSPSIPRVTPYEQGILNHCSFDSSKKEWNPDPLIMDERYMLIKTPKGLVVLSACSHAGIVNVVKDVRSRFPDDKIHWVQGGLHLVDGSKEKIESSCKDLLELGVEYIVPGHCTGFRAQAELERVFGVDKVVHSVVGARFDI